MMTRTDDRTVVAATGWGEGMSMLRTVTMTDWDDVGFGARFWRIVARLESAGADPDVVIDAAMTTARRRDGSVPRVAVVSFDGARVRDTWVHGWACDAGYLAHISA